MEVNQPYALLPINKMEDQESLWCDLAQILKSWEAGELMMYKPQWEAQDLKTGADGRVLGWKKEWMSNKRQQNHTPSSFWRHLDPSCIGWSSHTWARVDFWLFLFENFIHVCSMFWSNLPQVSPCQLFPCPPPRHFSLLMSYTLNFKPNEAT